MRRLAIATIALGIMISLSCAAMATLNTETWSWATTPGQTIIDWSATALLPQFNTNSGARTLLGVQVDLSSMITLTAGVENLTNQAATMSYGLDVETSVKKGATLLTNAHHVKNELNIQRAARDGNTDWAGPAGWNQVYAPVAVVANSYVAPVSEFAGYKGTGNISFDVSAATATWTPHNNVGSMAAFFVAEVPTTVTVTYTYDAVPEPASLLALGTGLISLVGFALKRRA